MVFRALLSLFASNWRFLLDDPPVTLSGSKVQVINDASLTVACFRVRAPVRDWLFGDQMMWTAATWFKTPWVVASDTARMALTPMSGRVGSSVVLVYRFTSRGNASARSRPRLAVGVGMFRRSKDGCC
mmetsp:Transcript_61413/g.90061  ORF Transcript_61413/g.90061 Transcript_61413/m.90061 type:complete len:128 (-) Transcript_61413:184-567(-)